MAFHDALRSLIRYFKRLNHQNLLTCCYIVLFFTDFVLIYNEPLLFVIYILFHWLPLLFLADPVLFAFTVDNKALYMLQT